MIASADFSYCCGDIFATCDSLNAPSLPVLGSLRLVRLFIERAASLLLTGLLFAMFLSALYKSIARLAERASLSLHPVPT